MTRAYKRAARLTVWQPRPSATSPLGAFFDQASPNAVIIDSATDLRMTWDIAKALGSTPNTCKIVVTNLAERTRAEFQTLPRKVVLEIAYDGEYQHLFSGDIRWATSLPTSPGWETTIEVADGGRAYREARIVKAFGPGTAAITAIKSAAAALGLTVPRTVEQRPELAKQFASGLALAGRASDELSRLLDPFGLGWSIQDGSLQILASGEVGAGQALVIDADAGLIGSPSYAPPAPAVGKKAAKGTGGKPVITVKCLTYLQVTPGGIVRVRARNVDHEFKVLKVGHVGGTHGDATTDIEAVER